jgi:ABC-type glycerol-3-phosphate transport system substrate-binding protein
LGYDFHIAGAPKLNGKQPVAVGSGQGWGLVESAKAHSPNAADAFLRLVCSRPGQLIYDKIYGGVAIVAWKDILENDTTRFSKPVASNATYQVDSIPGVKTMYETCKYIGEVGYYNKIIDAIVSTCQSVRLGKMNATQGAKAIQTLANAQYKQYQNDLANL